MKKKLMAALCALSMAATLALSAYIVPADNASTIPMYRLYNPVSGEHLYTADENEKTVLTTQYGWNYEGIGWTAPATSSTPVYRLFNRLTGEHLYTADSNERRVLLSEENTFWNDENIGWYSSDSKEVPVYRLFRPASAPFAHHYTTSDYEMQVNMTDGWNYEGIGWYGTKASGSESSDSGSASGDSGSTSGDSGSTSGDSGSTSGESGSTTEQVIVKPVTVYNGIDLSSIYDFNYYTTKHKDLGAIFASDPEGALNHFATYGIQEGRFAKASFSHSDYAKFRALLASSADMELSKKLAGTKTAAQTDQIILVVDHTLTQWTKSSTANTWFKDLETYCGYGKNGLASPGGKVEGDLKTPTGSWKIPFAFGILENPGTSMTYRQITANSYWSSEEATYNTWVESETPIAGEHLIESTNAYRHCIDTGYNENPAVFNKGSAIFLHCTYSSDWATTGCLMISYESMVDVLCNSHDGEWMMVVADASQIANY